MKSVDVTEDPDSRIYRHDVRTIQTLDAIFRFLSVFLDDRRYESVVVIYTVREMSLCSKTHPVLEVREF